MKKLFKFRIALLITALVLVFASCTNSRTDARVGGDTNSAYQRGMQKGFTLGMEDGYYRGYDDAQYGNAFGAAFNMGMPMYGRSYTPYNSRYRSSNTGISVNFGNSNRGYSDKAYDSKSYNKTTTKTKPKATQSKTHGFNKAKKDGTKVVTPTKSKTHGFGTKPSNAQNKSKTHGFTKKKSKPAKSKSSGFKSKSKSSSRRR